MEYNPYVHRVIETPAYLADAEKLFTEKERFAIVDMLANDPECGDLIKGTGGVRKVRVGRGGSGKRGGGRVVYIYYNTEHPIFILAAFAKNEKSNLTQAERNELAKYVKTLFKPTGRKP